MHTRVMISRQVGARIGLARKKLMSVPGIRMAWHGTQNACADLSTFTGPSTGQILNFDRVGGKHNPMTLAVLAVLTVGRVMAFGIVLGELDRSNRRPVIMRRQSMSKHNDKSYIPHSSPPDCRTAVQISAGLCDVSEEHTWAGAIASSGDLEIESRRELRRCGARGASKETGPSCQISW